MTKLNFPFDVPPPDGPHEPHFRRGYHHGATAMIEALRSGASLDDLEAFAKAELRAWREDHETPAYPPEPVIAGRPEE